MEQTKSLTTQQTANLSIYSSAAGFEHAQRIAKMLASSDLVPAQYQGNVANTLVALEMANRIGASPLMVMQNLNVIQGKPSFSSTFLIAVINTCGRFAPLRFDMEMLGPKEVIADIWEGPKGARTKRQIKISINDQRCTAWTVPAGVAIPANIRTVAEAKAAGLPIIKGEPVSIEMAVKEGWYTKNDSKWPNMPGLMLSYRAAAFFSRLHCPEITMGMHTDDEIIDVIYSPVNEPLTDGEKYDQFGSNVDKLNHKIEQSKKETTASKSDTDTAVNNNNTTGVIL